MEKPDRTNTKYWKGAHDFNYIQYEMDLEDYIFSLQETNNSKPVGELIQKMKSDLKYYEKHYSVSLKSGSLETIAGFKGQRNLIKRYLKICKGLRESKVTSGSKPIKGEIDLDVDLELVADKASCAINKIFKHEVLDILQIYLDLKYEKDLRRLA